MSRGQTAPSRVRVVLDTQVLLSQQTGTATYVRELERHLDELSDIELTTVHSRIPGVDSARPGRIARNLRDISWTEVGLPRTVRRLGADVLHAPAFFAPTWGAVPLVVTVHDLLFRLHPDQYRRWWRTYMELQLPSVLKRAAAIVVVSEQSRVDLVRSYDVSENRVHVVYLGVDHSRFRPLQAAVVGTRLARYGLDFGYILCIGALHKRKNVPELISAVAKCKADGTLANRKLVLAGPPSLGLSSETDVMKIIRQQQLETDVIRLGWVADEDLAALYNGASVLAFPSTDEGFGLPVVEAMACGTPVVAGPSAAVAEVTGGAAHYVPSSDPTAIARALAEILTQPRLRSDLVGRGLQRSSKFDWRMTANQTSEIYRDVANRASAAPGG